MKNHHFAIVLTAILIFFSLLFFNCQAYGSCCGDMNGDGFVTLQDVECIMQASVNICPTSCGDCNLECYDINEDGVISSFDAVQVYKRVSGTESILDAECPIITQEIIPPVGEQIIMIDQICHLAGEDLSFTIFVNDAPNDVTFFYFTVAYDPDKVEYKNCILGDLIQDSDLICVNHEASGNLIIAGDDAGIFQGESGSIVKIIFTVKKCEETTLKLFNFANDISNWTGQSGRLILDRGNENDSSYQISLPVISSLSDYEKIRQLSMIPIYLEYQRQLWHQYQLHYYQQHFIQTFFSWGQFWSFFSQTYWHPQYFQNLNLDDFVKSH